MGGFGRCTLDCCLRLKGSRGPEYGADCPDALEFVDKRDFESQLALVLES
jgi:hypothetical protein